MKSIVRFSIGAKDNMKLPKRMSEDARNATIERAEFDAAMNRLLRAKRPITKQEVSDRIKRPGRISSSSSVKRSDQR
jgi:hypothetical protein